MLIASSSAYLSFHATDESTREEMGRFCYLSLLLIAIYKLDSCKAQCTGFNCEVNFTCFENDTQLRQEVASFLADPVAYSESENAAIYGFPIQNWCVERVTNFSYLFANQQVFNSDLTFWNIASATDLR